jgi:hypothetical protein
MDSQFNTLLRSYSDNYIQFKVTGAPKFQQGYTAAQQGIESILSQMKTMVDAQKQQMSEFYKSGIEQKVTELNQRNRFLQRGLVSESDEVTAAHMRSDSSSIQLPVVQTWQYVTIGVLGATAIALSVM